MKWKSYISGLKWTGLKPLLFEISCKTKVNFKIIDRDRGFLRETIYFEIEGSEENIRKFNDYLKWSIKEYEGAGRK